MPGSDWSRHFHERDDDKISEYFDTEDEDKDKKELFEDIEDVIESIRDKIDNLD